MSSRLLAAVALAGLFFPGAGCATIVSGEVQKIKVTSEPPGAVVIAEPGKHRVTTPADLALPRGGGPYRLTFEKEGWRPADAPLSKGLNGWLFGNLFFGGILGIVVDLASGAAYDLSPEEVHVVLTPAAPPPAAGAAGAAAKRGGR